MATSGRTETDANGGDKSNRSDYLETRGCRRSSYGSEHRVTSHSPASRCAARKRDTVARSMRQRPVDDRRDRESGGPYLQSIDERPAEHEPERPQPPVEQQGATF